MKLQKMANVASLSSISSVLFIANVQLQAQVTASFQHIRPRAQQTAEHTNL